MKKHLIVLCVSMLCFLLIGTIGKAKAKETIYMKKGDTYSIKLKGKYSFFSNKKKCITISKRGNITAKRVGTGIITARKGKKKLMYKVTVLKKMKINGDSSYCGYNRSLQLTFPVKGSKVKWSSSNPDVALVDETGLVVAKDYGDCVITVTYLGKKYKYPLQIIAVPAD